MNTKIIELGENGSEKASLGINAEIFKEYDHLFDAIGADRGTVHFTVDQAVRIMNVIMQRKSWPKLAVPALSRILAETNADTVALLLKAMRGSVEKKTLEKLLKYLQKEIGAEAGTELLKVINKAE